MAVSTVARKRWLLNLATILVRPRRTMRQILDRLPDRMVVPLVLLAILSASLSDFDGPGFQRALEGPNPIPFVVTMIAAVLIAVTLGIILFYVFSWIAVGIGRMLEGRGGGAEVRSALAWGFAPIIWALLYRIPVALFGPVSINERGLTRIRLGDEELTFPAIAGDGCGMAVAFAILELTVLVWYLIVASRALGEAHHFSGWRGLAALMLSFVSPVILVIAALLTTAT